MSDASTNAADQLNLREQIVRIDRNIAETQKFFAEARKFDRERWLILVGAFGGVAGMIAAGVTAAKALGWLG